MKTQLETVVRELPTPALAALRSAEFKLIGARFALDQYAAALMRAGFHVGRWEEVPPANEENVVSEWRREAVLDEIRVNLHTPHPPSS